MLTIGYLVTEAETIWLTTAAGGAVPGHVLAYDQETGFGLVQALGSLNTAPLELGVGMRVGAGDRAIMAAEGGRRHAISARVVARQEFAGYWEYVLDHAIFTAPAHPFWGGAALIGADGRLIGIGSLHVQHSSGRELRRDVNMVVPIDLLPPILDDMLTYGRPNRPVRPWLGLYAAEVEDAIVVAGMAEQRAGEQGRAAARRPHSGGARGSGGEPRRFLAQGVGRRPGRQRGPAAGGARRRNLDGSRAVRRPHQVSQGAEAALTAGRAPQPKRRTG